MITTTKNLHSTFCMSLLFLLVTLCVNNEAFANFEPVCQFNQPSNDIHLDVGESLNIRANFQNKYGERMLFSSPLNYPGISQIDSSFGSFDKLSSIAGYSAGWVGYTLYGDSDHCGQWYDSELRATNPYTGYHDSCNFRVYTECPAPPSTPRISLSLLTPGNLACEGDFSTVTLKYTINDIPNNSYGYNNDYEVRLETDCPQGRVSKIIRNQHSANSFTETLEFTFANSDQYGLNCSVAVEYSPNHNQQSYGQTQLSNRVELHVEECQVGCDGLRDSSAYIDECGQCVKDYRDSQRQGCYCTEVHHDSSRLVSEVSQSATQLSEYAYEAGVIAQTQHIISQSELYRFKDSLQAKEQRIKDILRSQVITNDIYQCGQAASNRCTRFDNTDSLSRVYNEGYEMKAELIGLCRTYKNYLKELKRKHYSGHHLTPGTISQVKHYIRLVNRAKSRFRHAFKTTFRDSLSRFILNGYQCLSSGHTGGNPVVDDSDDDFGDVFGDDFDLF